MSIVNGTLDRQAQVLEACNMTENPFIKTAPPDELLERIFVGREKEIAAAARRVVDRPRNLLVYGGYGAGKTTFVRKLLSELRSAKKVSFLTGYAPLQQDTPQGFQLAALAALIDGALAAGRPGPLFDLASKTRDELSRLSLHAGTIGSPDILFADGLRLAHEAGFKRVVIAIDEVDKRDAQVVQEVLIGSRHLLDRDASFVLTGRYLDVFTDIRSSLLAAFDHRIELLPFSDDESRQILRRNLAAVRVKPEPEETLLPFEEPVVERMVAKARGLPRPLNLMAGAALTEALDEAVDKDLASCSITPHHLARALEREGNLIYNEVGAEARELLARMFQKKGYASGADLDALAPKGGLPAAVRELEQLSREDAVLRLDAADGPAFTLSPSVEKNLEALKAKRDKLRSLWEEALSATDKATRGRALEEFAAEFFAEAFVVRDRNVRTDTEELDLVLERTRDTDPRFGAETYLLVECKNWRAQPVDQTTVSKLATEIATRHQTHGFIVTTGRFTEDAMKQAKNVAASMNIEIVLLDGAMIESFLKAVTPVNDLLVEQHRRQTMRYR